MIIVPIIFWLLQGAALLALIRVLKWVFGPTLFTTANERFRTWWQRRKNRARNDGDVEMEGVSGAADAVTVTGTVSSDGSAPNGDDVRIPVTLTSDGKAHTGVPFHIPDHLNIDDGAAPSTPDESTDTMTGTEASGAISPVLPTESVNSSCVALAGVPVETPSSDEESSGYRSARSEAEESALTEQDIAMYTILQRVEWENISDRS
jgi:hypothetical protein